MDLAAAVAPTTLARQRTLPVADPLIPLLPDGALPRGRAVACGGIAATSLAVALAAEATVAGAWLAVVDVPWLGVEAVAELGVPLERLVRVDPGARQRAFGARRVVGRPRRRRPRRLRGRHHPRAEAGERRRPAPGAGQGAGPRSRADRRRRPWAPRRRHHDGGIEPGVGGRRARVGPPARPAGHRRRDRAAGAPAAPGRAVVARARWQRSPRPPNRWPCCIRWTCRSAWRRGDPCPPGWSRCGARTGRSSPPGSPPRCRRSCSTPTGSSPGHRPRPGRGGDRAPPPRRPAALPRRRAARPRPRP